MIENCFRNVQNIRGNVYDIIISTIYHKIKAEKQLQWSHPHLVVVVCVRGSHPLAVYLRHQGGVVRESAQT